uniref:Uncharacterized protein n=1 Tax=Chromera velia CCMP2878 TaxID=1169474 RepID=A0A0G4GPE6_9ALVE|eukprot:Cvel_22800.t1-p1 / transcript=Cvel_22800.t1 / gene=Cvel_22800 / organism=Chromera_velia_CCMP2878 / gene_product=hypothetical protein / transcript_product=hypothetical protein / location=Cvel_scaffold2281:19998-22596(+) / protein_length=482 / sequence_SO=supercontig / SO=protein_coding / is_pseudo=false
MESPSSRCSESDKLRLVKRSRLELLGSPRSDRDPFGSPKSIGVSSLWGDFPDLFVERERSSSTVDFHFFTKRVGERVGKGVSHVIHTFLANLTLAVRFPSELLPSETGTVVASLLHRGSSNDDLGVSVLQAFIQPENSRAALLKLAEADPLLFEILCNFLPSFVGTRGHMSLEDSEEFFARLKKEGGEALVGQVTRTLKKYGMSRMRLCAEVKKILKHLPDLLMLFFLFVPDFSCNLPVSDWQSLVLPSTCTRRSSTLMDLPSVLWSISEAQNISGGQRGRTLTAAGLPSPSRSPHHPHPYAHSSSMSPPSHHLFPSCDGHPLAVSSCCSPTNGAFITHPLTAYHQTANRRGQKETGKDKAEHTTMALLAPDGSVFKQTSMQPSKLGGVGGMEHEKDRDKGREGETEMEVVLQETKVGEGEGMETERGAKPFSVSALGTVDKEKAGGVCASLPGSVGDDTTGRSFAAVLGKSASDESVTVDP